MPLITFGHGTASAERIAELLRAADVRMLIDVRIAPGSRRNPHVARAELERWLPGHGIGYRWEKRLGGFRRRYYRLVLYALTAPLYWALMSIAAYKALWQLLRNPFYWEKTSHGGSDTARQMARAVQ